MCGFLITDQATTSTRSSVRGPDGTNIEMIDGLTLAHHLLHITGKRTVQPYHKDGLVCLFNGEIYNYPQFGDYRSDVECILDVYREYGLTFARHLDGEFAIVILDGDDLILATDPFATKPLWRCFNDGVSVGSYNSDLHAPGEKVPGNMTERWSVSGRKLQFASANISWDLEQYKDSTVDWIEAFKCAVHKRWHPDLFIGLSSGYDSGALACALRDFKAYSITNNENMDVIGARYKLLDDVYPFTLSDNEFQWLQSDTSTAEPFEYDGYDYKTDKATIGLAAICCRANRDGKRVYMSGQGADEIISDYGYNGRKRYPHSEFGGLFPQRQRLWRSFNDGTQIQYLNKEEYTAGHFGIEARYPYLDRQLVQEFLWLTPEVKNRNYKSPLHDYLTSRGFPFDEGVKRGFNCRAEEHGKTNYSL